MRNDERLVNLDRARAYRALARLFLPPTDSLRADLREELEELESALKRLGLCEPTRRLARRLRRVLPSTGGDGLRRAYDRLFEASGGLACPPHEASLAPDSPQEGLTRTFEMADVAGFYRAFGVEVAPGGERPDHLVAELEFMHLLALKEAIASGEGDGGERASLCRDAARAFLHDHLSRWIPRFAERLEAVGGETPYAVAGRLLERFVAHETVQLEAS